MAKNIYQKKIAKELETRQIAFNPDLAKALGSIKAGLFLSQLLYWWNKGDDPNWIYKTAKELQAEISLSKTEQLRAQKICVAKGLIEVRLARIPATRHFKINIDKIIELLHEYKQ